MPYGLEKSGHPKAPLRSNCLPICPLSCIRLAFHCLNSIYFEKSSERTLPYGEI